MPFGVAPNFQINGKTYCVPMVIEESSVVAAASAAAKFWMTRGGFHAEVLDVQKIGQVSFKWKGDFRDILNIQHQHKQPIQPHRHTGAGWKIGHSLDEFLVHGQPFYTTRERGTGLGLAMVRKIAEYHDGGVSVESPLPGKTNGTRFTLFLRNMEAHP